MLGLLDILWEVLRIPLTLYEGLRDGFAKRRRCPNTNSIMVEDEILLLHCERKVGHFGPCRSTITIPEEENSDENDGPEA
jgi:hypothetical protein